MGWSDSEAGAPNEEELQKKTDEGKRVFKLYRENIRI